MWLTPGSGSDVVDSTASAGFCATSARTAGSWKAELDLGSTARLAQSVERKALNLVVVGSSPTVGVLLFVGFAGVALHALLEGATTSYAHKQTKQIRQA